MKQGSVIKVGVFHTPDSYLSMLPLDALWLVPEYSLYKYFSFISF